MKVKSVLHAPASLLIGMWPLYCDEAGTKQMNATHGGGCHNSAITSSDASHTKGLSSCSTDGLLNDECDRSGAARFCSHLDRCFHMWQLYSVSPNAAFIAMSSLCCRCHPHEPYLQMYYLMPLCGVTCQLNVLCGDIS